MSSLLLALHTVLRNKVTHTSLKKNMVRTFDMYVCMIVCMYVCMYVSIYLSIYLYNVSSA